MTKGKIRPSPLAVSRYTKDWKSSVKQKRQNIFFTSLLQFKGRKIKCSPTHFLFCCCSLLISWLNEGFHTFTRTTEQYSKHYILPEAFYFLNHCQNEQMFNFPLRLCIKIKILNVRETFYMQLSVWLFEQQSERPLFEHVTLKKKRIIFVTPLLKPGHY